MHAHLRAGLTTRERIRVREQFFNFALQTRRTLEEQPYSVARIFDGTFPTRSYFMRLVGVLQKMCQQALEIALQAVFFVPPHRFQFLGNIFPIYWEITASTQCRRLGEDPSIEVVVYLSRRLHDLFDIIWPRSTESPAASLPMAVGGVLVRVEQMQLVRVLARRNLDRILPGEARIAETLAP